jgi:hypothetical protein
MWCAVALYCIELYWGGGGGYLFFSYVQYLLHIQIFASDSARDLLETLTGF